MKTDSADFRKLFVSCAIRRGSPPHRGRPFPPGPACFGARRPGRLGYRRQREANAAVACEQRAKGRAKNKGVKSFVDS